MSSRTLTGFTVPLLALALAAGCGGGSKEAAPAAGGGDAAPAAAIDPSTAATITGTIKLDGTGPTPDLIKMNADPVCVREGKGGTTEFIVPGDGGTLQNVFVYVKDGLGDRTFQAPTTPVVMNQKGCHYTPHVFGIMVGQPLQVVNSDPTLHNIHALPKANQEFNTGQPIQGMKFDHTFTAKEVMVPFKCDVHGWMNAHAAVLDHPFFAVSGKDGKFEIKGLPPGKYTIEAWHEKLGTQTMDVEVAAKDAKMADFTFKIST
jgi:plastocyanin